MDKQFVFIANNGTVCSKCNKDLSMGYVYFENGCSFCLECIGLGNLEYLPSGNIALTRRATKNSTKYAIVLKYSSARKRNERQGVLVEFDAIQKAKEECLKDEEKRKLRQNRNQIKIEQKDNNYIKQYADEIRKNYPYMPEKEEFKIAEHACEKKSGRVGRSASAKIFNKSTIILAVRAHIRHCYTDYDDLINKCYDKYDARKMVEDEISNIEKSWAIKIGKF